MSIYYVNPNDNFLLLLSKFILNHIRTQGSDVRIILPHNIHCQELKKILLTDSVITDTQLPQIESFEELVYQLLSDIDISLSIQYKLNFCRQKAILTTLIQKYNKDPIRTSDALKLSHSLLQLFHYIIYQQIKFSDIAELLQQTDSSGYWQHNYHFLNQIYTEWHQSLSCNIEDNQASLIAELRKLLTQKYCINTTKVIIAGLLPTNKLELAILQNIINLGIGDIILPPISLIDLKYVVETCKLNKKLYGFQCLLNKCQTKFEELYHLASDIIQPKKTNPLTSLFGLPLLTHMENIGNQDSDDNPTITIQYNETKTQFEEIKLVVKIIRQYLVNLDQSSCKNTILVIATTVEFAAALSMHLNKYNIHYNNLLCLDIKQLVQINFIILLADLIADDFNLDKFINFSKTPLLLKNYCHSFDKLVTKYRDTHLSLSLKEMLRASVNSDDADLSRWAEFTLESMHILWKYQQDTTIMCHELFASLLKVTTDLTSGQIWHLDFNKQALELLTKTKETMQHMHAIALKDFGHIVKELVHSIKIYDDLNIDARVVIADPDNSLLLNPDHIIITEFTNDNWPGYLQHNPWLHSALLSKLGIMDYDIHIAQREYLLYKILQTAPTIITRSQFNFGSNRVAESQLITKLQLLANSYASINIVENDLTSVNIDNYICDFNDNKYSVVPRYNKQYSAIQQQSCGVLRTVEDFTNLISVTDIDVLIRNPYAFYAKKILRLNPPDIDAEKLKYARFGKFIHNVIYHYTTTYQDLTLHKLIDYFTIIGKQLITNYSTNALTRTIWLTRLEKLATSFVIFDQQRRYKGNNIFAEQRGTISLNINNKPLSIVTVVDRIEYDSNGNCCIIDFKAGAIPSRKDIEKGLDINLMIKSMILQCGGFPKLPAITPNKVIFVKVATPTDTIKTLEIPVDLDLIHKYKKKIIHLLEYYLDIGGKFYSTTTDDFTLKNNHYKHLARHL